jgi:hypothetical protein
MNSDSDVAMRLFQRLPRVRCYGEGLCDRACMEEVRYSSNLVLVHSHALSRMAYRNTVGLDNDSSMIIVCVHENERPAIG